MTDTTNQVSKTLKQQWYEYYQKGADELEPNIPLLRKAVEWVEEQAAIPWEKREWDQAVYVSETNTESWKDRWQFGFREMGASSPMKECGTVMCVAGWLSIKHTPSNWEILVDPMSGTLRDSMFDPKDDDHYFGEVEHFLLDMSDIGAMLLGIPHGQATELFHGGNDAARVREIAEDIAGERL